MTSSLPFMHGGGISLGGNLLHRCKGDRRKGVGEFFKLFPLAEAGLFTWTIAGAFFRRKMVCLVVSLRCSSVLWGCHHPLRRGLCPRARRRPRTDSKNLAISIALRYEFTINFITKLAAPRTPSCGGNPAGSQMAPRPACGGNRRTASA